MVIKTPGRRATAYSALSSMTAITAATTGAAVANITRFNQDAFTRIPAANFVILDSGDAFALLNNDTALVLNEHQFRIDQRGNLVVEDVAVLTNIASAIGQVGSPRVDFAEVDEGGSGYHHPGARHNAADADQMPAASRLELNPEVVRLQASLSAAASANGTNEDNAELEIVLPFAAAFLGAIVSSVSAQSEPTLPPRPSEPAPPPPGPDVFSGFNIDLTGGAGVYVSGASIGDINHDEIDDWIVSASALSTNETTTYVIFGREGSYASDFDFQSLDAGEGFALDGIEHENSLDGVATATAGDVNGDGIDDLIIGSPTTDSDGTSGAGKSYVVFGKNVADDGDFSTRLDVNNDLNGTNGFAINGGSLLATSGSAVSTAGDINADGVDDIIIGAPGENGLAGRSYVVFGKNVAQDGDFLATFDLASLTSPDGDGSNGFIINGIATGDQSGHAISHAGDINGDGIADVIIGAHQANSGDGQSYVVFGKDSAAGETFNPHFDLSALDGRNGFVINGVSESGTEIGHGSGFSVSSAGDINGDGIDDVVVGADSQNAWIGASYVVFGKNVAEDGDFSPSLDLASLMTSDPDGPAGFMISINSSEGRITEIVDRYLGLSRIGYSVSDAGDVNRDGLDDLIIGAPYTAWPTQGPIATAGVAYVVFGSSNHSTANLDLKTDIVDGDGNRGFVILSPEPENNYYTQNLSGFSVSSVGDINKDGFGDILIGNSGTEESHVIFGMDNFAPFVHLEDLAGLA